MHQSPIVVLSEQESQWIQGLKAGDENALEKIFHQYYRYLVVTAYHYLKDDGMAKDLVQDVFFKIWEKRSTLNIDQSLKAFLRRSVINRCIDELRKKRIQWDLIEESPAMEMSGSQDGQSAMETTELKKVVQDAIATLPDRCRLIFMMSRTDEMSHQEISDALDISKKTIENQITKAIKVIRIAVRDYGMIWIVLWINI